MMAMKIEMVCYHFCQWVHVGGAWRRRIVSSENSLKNLYQGVAHSYFWKIYEWYLFLFKSAYFLYISLVAQMVQNLFAMQEIWVWSLGWEDPLEKGMATHSSILAWGISWTGESGGLQSKGSQRVRHDWATNPLIFINFTYYISIKKYINLWYKKKVLNCYPRFLFHFAHLMQTWRGWESHFSFYIWTYDWKN